MENKIINIDEMSFEELSAMQERINQRKQQSLEERVKSLENEFDKGNSDGRVVTLESTKGDIEKKFFTGLELLKTKIDKMSSELSESKEKINNIQEETESVTKTLLTHGSLKRELDNHIHRIIYNQLQKDTLRDELFHGTLSRNCKAHIVKALDVPSYPYIRIDDLDTAKKLSNKCLSSVNIHNMMKKESERLMIKLENSNNDNSKTGTHLARKFSLLDKLLDEVGGDISAI